MMICLAALAVLAVLIIVGVISAAFGTRTRECILRDNSEDGSPYHSPEKLKELRAVPLKDVLRGLPRSGFKLIALFALACALSFALGECGHTARTSGNAVIGLFGGASPESIDGLYIESMLRGELNQESRWALDSTAVPDLVDWLREHDSNISRYGTYEPTKCTRMVRASILRRYGLSD